MLKMMARMIALMLAVGYCVPAMAEVDPFMAAAVEAVSGADLQLEEAAETARKAISQEAGETFVSDFGMTACLVTITIDGEQSRAWHIVLCNGARDVDDCYAATVLSPSGEVAGVDRYNWKARREEWEEEKGPYPLWTAEDKALFYTLYTGTAEDVYGDGMPQAHDLTSGQAVGIAREALIEQKGADPEALDALILSTWFQVRLSDAGYEGDYWCVLYLAENPNSPSGYDTIYQANISSPDGEVYLLYNLNKDGASNG